MIVRPVVRSHARRSAASGGEGANHAAFAPVAFEVGAFRKARRPLPEHRVVEQDAPHGRPRRRDRDAEVQRSPVGRGDPVGHNICGRLSIGR